MEPADRSDAKSGKASPVEEVIGGSATSGRHSNHCPVSGPQDRLAVDDGVVPLPGGLRHLIFTDRPPWVAVGLLLFGFVVTLGSAAMGSAIMAAGCAGG
jgi:hypothetical protein